MITRSHEDDGPARLKVQPLKVGTAFSYMNALLTHFKQSHSSPGVAEASIVAVQEERLASEMILKPALPATVPVSAVFE